MLSECIMKLDQDDIDAIAKATVALLRSEIYKSLMIAAVAFLVIEYVFHRWLGWI